MGNKNLPKLTHGYLRCNKIPARRSLLWQPWPIWAKGVGGCRFTSQPRQQLLTEASTGVDHRDRSQHGSRCKPWRHKSIWRERLLLNSWFSLRNRQENAWRLLRQRKEIGVRKGLHRVHVRERSKDFI